MTTSDNPRYVVHAVKNGFIVFDNQTTYNAAYNDPSVRLTYADRRMAEHVATSLNWDGGRDE